MQNWLQLVIVVIVLLNGFIAWRTSRQVRQVKIEVDGRLTQLLALTAKSSHAEGMKDYLVAQAKEGVHPLPPSRPD